MCGDVELEAWEFGQIQGEKTLDPKRIDFIGSLGAIPSVF
jgi:hypothetical protein